MSRDKDGNWFKRHKVLTVILVIILLAIIGGAASGDKSKSNNTSTSNSSSNSNQSSSSKPKATVAKLNEPVRDGKFEFTVTSVTCGKTSVGTNQYLTKTAQGQFCLLNMTVKNIGNEAQTLDANAQYLFNAAGQKYSADTTATLYATPSDSASSSWYNDINPGNTVNGSIVFDIPKDQTPTSAELHDSSLSNGIKVNLQ